MVSKSSNVESLFNDFANQNIMVVGDIMLDRFIGGAVHRQSPEAPVPVFMVDGITQMLGGAGNTLANIAGLGAHAYAVGLIGDDAHGEALLSLVEDLGIEKSGLLTDGTRPTTTKTRYLDEKQHYIRVDHEALHHPSQAILDQLFSHIEEVMDDINVILLCDHHKGVLEAGFCQRIIALAHQKSVPVYVDPKGADCEKFKGAALIKPNRSELSTITNGMPVKTEKDIIAAAHQLIHHTGIDSVLATLSEDGMIYSDAISHITLPAADVKAVDVSGCGDTVIAVMAVAHAAGLSLEDALALASKAAGIVIQKKGTVAIQKGDLT